MQQFMKETELKTIFLVIVTLPLITIGFINTAWKARFSYSYRNRITACLLLASLVFFQYPRAVVTR